MNITVYCGANCGRDPEFGNRARQLGTWMGQNGHRLVYGAGDVGMMGILSNAVLEAGGDVLGVTPAFFIRAEEIHEKLTELRITADLTERRSVMIQEGDAFIALPGGTGTLDEISEVMCLTRLGLLGEKKRPVMLYNINGYYDILADYLDQMVAEGFMTPENRGKIFFAEDTEDLASILRQG